MQSVLKVLIDGLTVGMAVLCLLAYKLGNRNRFVSFMLALVVLVVVTAIAIMSYQAWELLLLQVHSIVTILLVFVFAGWCCGKRYAPLRFMLWMAFWTMVISLDVMITAFLFYEGLSDPIGELIRQVPEVLLVGLIFAFWIYVLNLPFMILAFASPFYSERFYAYFRLISMPISSPSGTEKPLNADLEQKE